MAISDQVARRDLGTAVSRSTCRPIRGVTIDVGTARASVDRFTVDMSATGRSDGATGQTSGPGAVDMSTTGAEVHRRCGTAGGQARPGARRYASSTSGVTSRPRPSTSTSTTSPPLSQTGSFIPAITPAGVPVMKMSPGTSVK